MLFAPRLMLGAAINNYIVERTIIIVKRERGREGENKKKGKRTRGL